MLIMLFPTEHLALSAGRNNILVPFQWTFQLWTSTISKASAFIFSLTMITAYALLNSDNLFLSLFYWWTYWLCISTMPVKWMIFISYHLRSWVPFQLSTEKPTNMCNFIFTAFIFCLSKQVMIILSSMKTDSSLMTEPQYFQVTLIPSISYKFSSKY
jgi:hypothetical protein